MDKKTATDSYYYADADKMPVGPLTLSQLQELAARGVIAPNTKVIRKGDKAWVSYLQLPEFQKDPYADLGMGEKEK